MTDTPDLSKEAPSNRDEIGRLTNQRDYNRRLADHQKTVIDRLNAEITAMSARIAELEAEAVTVRSEVLSVADQLGHHCVGCGHMCGDPEKDLAILRKAGKRSCCPERTMEPLSDTFKAMIPLISKEPPHDT